MITSFNKKIWLLTAIYLMWLLIVLFIFGYTPTNDTESYIEYANIVISEKTFYPSERTIIANPLPFIWNIGSINLIVASLALFVSFYPLLPLMCLMKAFTAFFTAKIAERLFNQQVALSVMILYIFYPNNWGQSTTLLSETPMVFLEMASIYLLMSENRKNNAFGGALLAIANWFRPVAIVIVISMIIYWLFCKRKQWFQKSIILLISYTTVITVIGGINYFRIGHFVYQAESLWFNMAEATYENGTSPRYNTDPYPKGTARYIENRKQKTCFECNQIWKERSIAWLKKHPIDYLEKVPGRLLHLYYADIDNISAFRTEKQKPEENFITLPYRHLFTQFLALDGVQLLAFFNTIFYGILMICFLLSIFKAIPKLKNAFLPLFIVIFGSISLVLVVHGETRFKAPYMPFIFIMAAFYLQSMWKRNLT